MLRRIGFRLVTILMVGLTGVLTARAEVVTSPTQALKLLTQARLLADRCGYLDPSQRRELTDLAARAELSVVRRVGARAASAAVRQGRAAAGACGEDERELVNAVYEGAREAALRGASRQSRSVAGSTRRGRGRLARGASRSASRTAGSTRVRKVSLPVAAREGRGRDRNRSALARYRSFATAYYLALKCRNRPQGELMRMWRKVRDLHYAMVRKAGGRAVARAKAAAERAARASSCR